MTTMARTIVDVARNHSADAALGMADAAARAGLLAPEDLFTALHESGYRAKLAAPRLVGLLVDGRRESVGESRTALVCHRLGITALVPQYVVVDDSGMFVARVDFADPSRKIAIEFDGLAKYDMQDGLSRREVLEQEKKRQERLMALDWRVIRLTWSDLNDPRRYRAALVPLLR